MGRTAFSIPVNRVVPPCPKCGNNTMFVCKSEQVCEDGCEVWVECTCGNDPHKPGDRMEDVWGSRDEDSIRTALSIYSDCLKPT